MTDLDAQAERQRLRAPEPFEDVEPLPIPKPSRYVDVVRHRRQPTDWSSLPSSFWMLLVGLIPLAIYVNPWILWIGLVVYGLVKAFSAKPT